MHPHFWLISLGETVSAENKQLEIGINTSNRGLQISQASKNIRKVLLIRSYSDLLSKFGEYRFKNMLRKESLTRSSTVI